MTPQAVVPFEGATHACSHPPQLFESEFVLTHAEPHLTKGSEHDQPQPPPWQFVMAPAGAGQ